MRRTSKRFVAAIAMSCAAVLGSALGTMAVTTNWETWGSFTSSGVTMCAQDRATMDPTDGSIGAAQAWGFERALDTSCTSLHSRPAGYYGLSVYMLRSDGATILTSNGYKYNSASANYLRVNLKCGCSLDTGGYGFKTTAVGREYNKTLGLFHTDPGSATIGWTYYP